MLSTYFVFISFLRTKKKNYCFSFLAQLIMLSYASYVNSHAAIKSSDMVDGDVIVVAFNHMDYCTPLCCKVTLWISCIIVIQLLYIIYIH